MNGSKNMVAKKLFLIIGLVISNSLVFALGYEHCFDLASMRYQIPSKLLKAIATTESKNNPLAIGWNKNRSYDIGMMQINSTWLPKLNRVGISERDLFDGCKNIQVGAWILAENIKRHGFNTKAIGAYNSPTPYYQERYARKVLSNIQKD